MKRNIILLVITTIILSSMLSFVTAETSNIIYVDDIPGEGPDNPSEDFTSIQDALGAAWTNDIIYVYSGVYKENIKIQKILHVIGENPNTTIIDGQNKDITVRVISRNVVFKGFSVINSKFEQAGIYIQNGFTTISDCIIQDNHYGIVGIEFGNITIKNCTIRYNAAQSIHMFSTSNVTISQCDVYGNGNYNSSIPGDIKILNDHYFPTKYNIYINNCTIHDNDLNGISVGNGGWEGLSFKNVFIENNRIERNKKNGILIWQSEVFIGNNFIFENGKNGTYDSGIYLQDCQQLITVENNVIESNKKTGLYLMRSNKNIIKNNNFIDHNRQVNFIYSSAFPNKWIHNYYDNCTMNFIKIFSGIYDGYIILSPWKDFELFPAIEPNDIEVMN